MPYKGKSIHFAVTVDVEEDNWGDFENKNISLQNIDKLEALQKLFDRYRVRPTYLLTYPVARDRKAISILRKILEQERCEIGTHIHPFNTPPFEEEINLKNSMLCNLPKGLQYRKIEVLHETIYKNFGVEPVSFRSGRWACDTNVLENISKLKYRVDSSVTPYIDWTSIFGPDYSAISPASYRIPICADPGAYVLEVPATIGFLQRGFEARNKILHTISKNGLGKLKIVGLLNKLKIINKVWLSPEMSDAGSMRRLAQTMQEDGYKILNMFFHSPSLMAGCTPYTKSLSDQIELLNRIEKILELVRMNEFQSITLSEYSQGEK